MLNMIRIECIIGKIVLKPKEAQVFFRGLSMRFKQGRTPSVAQKDIEFILTEVELSQSDLLAAASGDLPRVKWIVHATVLVKYLEICSKKSFPIHWGTFQLTHEPLLEPPELLADAMKKPDFRTMNLEQ